ncbi:MAG: peptigoglycan-binding protein LysM, partial [Myxococcales bacterium]
FYPSADELPAQVAGGEQQPQNLDDGPVAPPQELADISEGNLNAPDLMGQDEDVVAVSGPFKIGFVPPKSTVTRQDGFVTQRELEDAGVITRSFAEKSMLSTFDKVYIRFRNSSQVRVGEKYVVYRTVEPVRHPTTGEQFGFLTHVVGTLKVVGMENQVATAIIEGTYDAIERGHFVGPWGSMEKQILSKAATREIQGIIVSSLVPRLPFMGENHMVFIDKGKRDGVEEGNVFRVVRQGDPLLNSPEENARYPKEEVATIVVVDVTNEASAALVLKSIRELQVGDKVESRTGAQVSAR